MNSENNYNQNTIKPSNMINENYNNPNNYYNQPNYNNQNSYFNQPNYNGAPTPVPPKKNNSNGCIIFFLILIIIALVGYILYDKGYLDSIIEKIHPQVEEKVEEQEEEETKKEESNVETINLTDEKITETNEKLAILKTNLQTIDISINDYDKELLNTGKKKFQFAWHYAVINRIGDYNEDATITGEEATGGWAIKYDDFVEYYKKLLGIEFDNVYNYNGYYNFEKGDDGYLYGYISSGYTEDGTVYKINSVTKTEEKYTVIIDVLKYDLSNDEMENKYIKYSEYNCLEYPEEDISYKLQIIAYLTDDTYTFESLKSLSAN